MARPITFGSLLSPIAGLPEDVVEKLDLVFYGDVDRAVLKTLEL